MEGRAILSLSPENIITIGLVAGFWYLVIAVGYQAWRRLGGGGGATVVNPQSGM
jgi:hypothetical protein